LEAVTRKIEINKADIILNRSMKYVVYIDEAYLINRNGNDFKVGFIQLLKARPNKKLQLMNTRLNAW
jgi:hypothetical protein